MRTEEPTSTTLINVEEITLTDPHGRVWVVPRGAIVSVGVDWADPREAARQQLLDELEQLLGPEAREAFERRHQRLAERQEELLNDLASAELAATRPWYGRRRRQRYRQRCWRLSWALGQGRGQ